MGQEFRRADDDPLTKKVKLAVWAVGQIGVPAVLCGAVLWMMNTTIKEQTKSFEEFQSTISTGFTEIKDVLKEQNRILKRRGSGDVAYLDRDERPN